MTEEKSAGSRLETTEFKAADYLDTPESVAAYIAEAKRDGGIDGVWIDEAPLPEEIMREVARAGVRSIINSMFGMDHGIRLFAEHSRLTGDELRQSVRRELLRDPDETDLQKRKRHAREAATKRQADFAARRVEKRASKQNRAKVKQARKQRKAGL